MKMTGTEIVKVEVSPFEALDAMIFDTVGYGWVDKKDDSYWLCTEEKAGQRRKVNYELISPDLYEYVTALETAKEKLYVLQTN